MSFYPLPAALEEAIQQQVQGFSVKQLIEASTHLTDSYHGAVGKRHNLWRQAYLLTRMPATFAAMSYVFKQLAHLAPTSESYSLLDIGCGPGTSLWAAQNSQLPLSQTTLVDQDSSFINIAKTLWKEPFDSHHLSVNRIAGLDNADIVCASYMLNELTSADLASTLRQLWTKTNRYLILIEPGSRQGFANILHARQIIMGLQGHVLAPCTGQGACPLADHPQDWCHFSVRLPRTTLHRQIKQASLGHEDEKFSYLIMSRQPVKPLTKSRIIRHPLHRSGQIILDVCTSQQQFERQHLSKKNRAAFQQARKSEWGDLL